LASDDAIDVVLDRWPVEWRTTSHLAVGSSKSVTQHKNEEAKLKKAQLAKKGKKEVIGKSLVECDATQHLEKQTGKTECDFDKGARSPSPETKEEMDKKIE